MAGPPPELCLLRTLDRGVEADEDAELEVAPAARLASDGLSSPLSGSIVLLTGFGLKVTVRDGFMRPTSAAGRRGDVSCDIIATPLLLEKEEGVVCGLLERKELQRWENGKELLDGP